MLFLESAQFNQAQGRGNSVQIAGITLPLPQKDKFTSVFVENIPRQPIFFLALLSPIWLTSMLSSQKSDSNLTPSTPTSQFAETIGAEERSTTKFFGSTVDGFPTTMVQTPDDVTGGIIQCKNKFLSWLDYTPQIRCEQVYNRF